MATTESILFDAFDRIADGVRGLVGDVPVGRLNDRPLDRGNPIGWLVWHLTRVQDDHISEVAEQEQVWTTGGWEARFDLPHKTDDVGYGHDDAQVGVTRIIDPNLLTDYHRAVHEMTCAAIRRLSNERLDEIIDTRFDPPVTVAVRVVSVIEDCLQHLGQAAYVAGLLNR